MADVSTGSRVEKSLFLLTKSFFNLLQESHDGALDLRLVKTLLTIYFAYITKLKMFCFHRLQIPWTYINGVFMTSQMF